MSSDKDKQKRKVEELEKQVNYLFIENAKHIKDIESMKELITEYMQPFLSLGGVDVHMDEEAPKENTPVKKLKALKKKSKVPEFAKVKRK